MHARVNRGLTNKMTGADKKVSKVPRQTPLMAKIKHTKAKKGK